MGKYKSLGNFFDRIFRNDLNKNFDDVDADIKVQKARVDNLITGNPQPEEVMDLRTDTEGIIHGTAWDRFASDETKKTTKFQEISDQLAETANTLKQGQPLRVKKPETTVVFISDDNSIEDYTVLKPIFESRGIPCVIGAVSDWVGLPNKLAAEQLRELQSIGWEIASHSVSHKRLQDVTLDVAEFELSESKRRLESLGLKINNFVYPNNSTNNDIRKIVSKYYDYACYGNGLINTLPLTPYSLHRVALGAYFDGGGTSPTYGDTTTFDSYYKVKVDEAIAEGKSILIFMLHPGFTQDFTATQRQYLEQTIDYIQSQGVEILTLNDAVVKMGNYFSAGNYNWESPEDYFIIGADGKVNSSFGQQFITNDVNVTNISSLDFFRKTYKPNSIVIKSFGLAAGSTFPGSNAGTLTTFSPSASDMAYQTWQPFNSTDVYKRLYDTASKTWKVWEIITSKILQRTETSNAYTSTDLITAFPQNVVTMSIIGTAGATGFPENAAGILTTNRISGENGYPRQTYEVYQSTKKYVRFVQSTGAWSEWQSEAIKTTIERPAAIAGFTLSAGQYVYKAITTTQTLSGANIINVTPFNSIPNGIIWSWSRASSSQIFVSFYNTTAAPITVPDLSFNINQILP